MRGVYLHGPVFPRVSFAQQFRGHLQVMKSMARRQIIRLPCNNSKNGKVGPGLDKEQPLVLGHAPRLQILCSSRDHPGGSRDGSSLILSSSSLSMSATNKRNLAPLTSRPKSIASGLDSWPPRRSFSSSSRISSGGASRGKYHTSGAVGDKVFSCNPGGYFVSTVAVRLRGNFRPVTSTTRGFVVSVQLLIPVFIREVFGVVQLR